jgi:hypothetical protein
MAMSPELAWVRSPRMGTSPGKLLLEPLARQRVHEHPLQIDGNLLLRLEPNLVGRPVRPTRGMVQSKRLER